jgi:hypothetical protein
MFAVSAELRHSPARTVQTPCLQLSFISLGETPEYLKTYNTSVRKKKSFTPLYIEADIIGSCYTYHC